jgi:hypothetical protein
MFGIDIQKHGKTILYAVVAAYLLSVLSAFLVAFLARLDWIVVFGAFWLGALLGTLLGFYVQEATEWDPRALRVSVWIVAGSSILLLLQLLGPKAGAREVWFYPIGLVAGFMIGTIWEYVDPPPSE